MLTDARQKLIEELISKNGEVIISVLAKELGVSVETVRRDINALSQAGRLVKVHGGAVSASRPIAESRYEKRRLEGSQVKEHLGAEAAKHIDEYDVVAISTGSTMESVARHITDKPNATVVTNSTAVAAAVKTECRCVLLGGQLHPEEGYTFGPVTVEQLANFHTDKAFISASAVTADGLMTTGIEEGDLQRKMIENASHVILVVQSTKLGARSVYRYAGLDTVDEIILDKQKPLDPELKKALDAFGIMVHTID